MRQSPLKRGMGRPRDNLRIFHYSPTGAGFVGLFLVFVAALGIHGVFPHVPVGYDLLMGLPLGAALSVLLGTLVTYVLGRLGWVSKD